MVPDLRQAFDRARDELVRLVQQPVGERDKRSDISNNGSKRCPVNRSVPEVFDQRRNAQPLIRDLIDIANMLCIAEQPEDGRTQLRGYLRRRVGQQLDIARVFL